MADIQFVLSKKEFHCIYGHIRLGVYCSLFPRFKQTPENYHADSPASIVQYFNVAPLFAFAARGP